MGVYYESIPTSLTQWILDQKMLWVGSAPLSADGHINISPKGGQYFGIVDERTFWFMDLTGSGVETTSHLHEPGNGRICIMFMAFEGAPKIVRLWGKGVAMENGSPEFGRFVEQHGVKTIPGSRSIVKVHVHQVGSSCGFSVPYYEFKGFRSTLNDFFETKDRKFKKGKEEESMERYWAYKSQLSVDGLPGMKVGYQYARQHGVAPLKKFVGEAGQRTVTTPKSITPVELALVAVLSLVIGVTLTLTLASPDLVRKIQYKEFFPHA
ncbi:hypothetical protein K491DRAFT_722932 [Lophiostoma macrostomum CBS 122681]|uniref:Pyridoxamine 5'-phosphate oxidase putative domain-containing protein n=1 Tax=Lophiostoma macrostomum CBS 122681 TaxID=1314788 RepID=A0A6A6SJU3_9PLEO|nr:hypothetical protein K491DRAFT_722932 [Lophiostoma macrostomum CBS 122681]